MSDDRTNWRKAAEDALRGQRWTEAVQITRERLEESRLDAQAWVFLAEGLENLGQFPGAWRCYDRGWMLDPQAGWAPVAEERLRERKNGPIPDWLNALLQVPKVRVVSAILAKNEAENIERCITALQPAVDQVVVVDTGSEDGTVEIAERLGAVVVRTAWQNDFGLARQAAEPALGDEGWVLWVDADEFLDPRDAAVPRTVAGLYSLSEVPVLLRFVQVNHIGDQVEPNYDTTRMFPLGKDLTWKGRIHEQVVFRGEPRPMQRGAVRIRVDHWGYEREVMQARAKYERNIALLQAWTQDEPNNTAAWGFLGRDLFIAGRIQEAVDALYRAELLAGQDMTYGRTPEIRGVLCEALVALRRFEEARAVAERAVQASPDHPVGWYWRGHVALLEADEKLKIAIESTQKSRAIAPQYRGIVSFTRRIPEFLAPLTEADAMKMQGRWVEAYQLYKALARANPDQVGVARQVQIMEERAEAVVAAKQKAEVEPAKR